MRVLQFGRFWNEEHGGIERHAAMLCKGLAKEGVEVVNLVAALPGAGPSDRMLADGYRLVQVRSAGQFVSTALAPMLPLKALALHRQKPFDIFHLHLPDPLSHFTSMLLPAGVPRVLGWHSDIIRQKRLVNLYLPFLRREIRSAAALVASTKAHFVNSSQIPPDVPETRKHVIPYGLDYTSLEPNPFTDKLAAQLRARAAGRPILFALGRHVYYKGFDVLIDALAKTEAFLYLGGNGPLLEQHRAQARALGLESRIDFCGRIPEESLAAYFHACDIFCLPSVEQSEAFGLVQLEAMACGKPVVASQLHNGVNVVNQDGVTGVAVPVRNPGALTDAIRALLNDRPRLMQLGRQARDRAFEVYSLESMSRKTLALYREILAAKA